MSGRSLLGWVLFLVWAVVQGLSLVLDRVNGAEEPFQDLLVVLLAFVSFAAVGALLIARTRNPIGWMFMGVAYGTALANLLSNLGTYGFKTNPGSVPGMLAWYLLGSALWFPSFTFIVLSLLVFPNGRLRSRRWRPMAWTTALGGISAITSYLIRPGPMGDLREGPPNPLGIEGAEGVATVLEGGIILLGVGLIASVASLALRYRNSIEEERNQYKLIAYTAAVMALLITIQIPASSVIPNWVSNLLSGLILLALPAAMGIAILRYRLYDIDIVINKTVVYGALAVFITAVYLGMVAGIGALVGSRGNVLLSILATALIALAFQPVRERVQRLANKLVYGERMSPYEAMAELSHQVAGAISLDDVLPRMARTAAEGVGAARSRVRVLLPDGEERDAWWPQDQVVDSFDRRVPVIHRQEEIGEIAVAKSPGESLSAAEEKLLSDLASQAGLALRNVRLTEDLRASRRRIVTAQDEERRRMERDIHDGAQQQLVSLAVKLGLAENLASKDPSRATEMLRTLRTEVNDVVDSIRDLARGIYPPLLSEAGIAAALKADINKLRMDAEIKAADGDQRFEPQVEAAVYFCIREALQNASKHAAGRATVDLWFYDDTVGFSVTDRGPGFDTATAGRGAGLQNMIDRLEAIGGTLEIRSAPGKGTTVSGRVPAPGYQGI